MKQLATTFVLLAGAASSYPQGQVDATDYNSPYFNIHIWSPSPASSSVEQTGNSPPSIAGNSAYNASPDAPPGTTRYGGTLVGGSGNGPTSGAGYANGDNFDLELYAAPGILTTFSLSTFSAIGALGPLGDGSLPANWAGIWQGPSTVLTVPGVAVGSAATFAIAAWYNKDGTVTSLNQAEGTPGGVPFGISPLGTEDLGGDTIPPPYLPTSATSIGGNPGISSFSLGWEVAEPSTMTLAILGALAFLTWLRREQKGQFDPFLGKAFIHAGEANAPRHPNGST